MLDKATALREVLRILEKMHVGDRLQLLTWKGDRSLLFEKQSTEDILIIERGFVVAEQVVPFAKVKKMVKKLLKREFPRSHKIRTKLTEGT